MVLRMVSTSHHPTLGPCRENMRQNLQSVKLTYTRNDSLKAGSSHKALKTDTDAFFFKNDGSGDVFCCQNLFEVFFDFQGERAILPYKQTLKVYEFQTSAWVIPLDIECNPA
jgi:hypothetical protein